MQQIETGTLAASEGVLSVSSLNRMARSLLEGNFPAVLVAGEISNFTTPSSGHWYLSLKDRQAQIRCAMFRGNNRLLRFRPSNGMQVLVRGRLSIYEPRGDYQLIVESMELSGDGELRRAFEQLKAKLDAEGLFSSEQKQPVGRHYDHIGIVTSPSGAAIKDIVSVFQRRFPAIRLTLFPVAVQGAAAAAEIADAIALANRLREKVGVQALIVGRGGGSLEDLQAFNEEIVARAIHASSLPITSAVGHEIDFTIADFVADLRAPTPSAAAEQMSPSQEDYRNSLLSLRSQLSRSIGKRLDRARQSLLQRISQLKRPDRRLQEHAQTLDRLEGRLLLAMRNRIALGGSEVRQLQRGLQGNSPLARLRESRQTLSHRWRSLRRSALNRLDSHKALLAELSRSLSAVSPLNTLARGYSITYDKDSRLVRRSGDVEIGSRIETRLHTGSILSTVDAVLAEGHVRSADTPAPAPDTAAHDDSKENDAGTAS